MNKIIKSLKARTGNKASGAASSTAVKTQTNPKPNRSRVRVTSISRVVRLLVQKLGILLLPKIKWFASSVFGFVKRHYRYMLVVVLLFSSHAYIYDKGKDAGYNVSQKKISQDKELATNQLINKKSVPYRSLSGTITELKADKITIKTVNGPDASFTMNNQTKYSNQGKTITPQDLKIGNKVTVFALDSASLAATHVVVAE